MPEGWGVMPAQACERLRTLEWQHRDHLRERLAGERPFPITLPLKPPAGPDAIADVARFRDFVSQWRAHPLRDRVVFEKRGMRGFDEQDVPVRLELRSMAELAELLGSEAETSLTRWEHRIEALSKALPRARREVIRRLAEIDALSEVEFADLVKVLPQLTPGMGRGGYVRSLPIAGVGTKFVEQHAALIEGLLRAAEENAALALYGWLDIVAAPTGTVLVRILDPALSPAFAGLSTFWAASRDVVSLRVPDGAGVLIVENAQSVLSLPVCPGVVAIGATGRDLSWVDAPSLKGRSCWYWGDLDTWGFHLLESARLKLPEIVSILMDEATLAAHDHQRSREPAPFTGALGGVLTQSELNALKLLQVNPARGRLEQEKLPASFVAAALAVLPKH